MKSHALKFALRIKMTVIKKLDLYILKKFLLIFAGAFFVVLFVFLMQFTWKFVDTLVGKGLTFDVLAKFYWYTAITLVRDSLPLSVLLASLITFGNLGESFELLAIKAAGIPLIRVMRPLAIFALLMSGASFYFQNVASPNAQMEMRTMLFSMRQQSPAVEIPEGVFYNGVPNINIYVQRKNVATGMLYQTIIYKTDQGFDRAQIVLADSARLEITKDKKHLRLELWDGEQFESLQSAGSAQAMMQNGAHEPFDRETFIFKTLLIDFDSNFNMMDKSLLSGMATSKNMRQIEQSVDSMNRNLDSLGRQYYKDAQLTYYRRPKISKSDSLQMMRLLQTRVAAKAVNFDTLTSRTSADKMQLARQQALTTVQSATADLDWKSVNTQDEEKSIRSHWVEWHNKITYSLACLLFFFVGAPLGAIIRKGGLGMPTIISVAIFIVWYVVYTWGMKMARDGNVNMMFGMWFSTIVIAPFGVFFTYKANKDSVVFNIDAYRHFFSRLLGLSTKRHIFRKEVIIDDPRLDVLPTEIEALKQDCIHYNKQKNLYRAPGYINIFFRYQEDTEVEQISSRMEAIVEELSNSKDRQLLAELNKLPILFTQAHTSPFHKRWLNVVAGVVFPLGLVLWFRIWRFRLRLFRDMRVVVRTCDRLLAILNGTLSADEENDEIITSTSTIETPTSQRRKKVLFWTKRIVLALIIIAALSAGGYYGWQMWKHHQHEKTEKSVKDDTNASNATHNVDNSETKSLPLLQQSGTRQLKLPERAPE